MTPFQRAFIEALLWSTNDESTPDGGQPLDKNYSVGDFDEMSLAVIQSDCTGFECSYGHLYDDPIQAGHDYALTRNGHGVGFWDRPEVYGPTNAKALTQASKARGECNVYAGDDGRLYI
jgi:hypothetical protein